MRARRTAAMQMQHTVANHVEHCMDSIMQNAVAAASAAEKSRKLRASQQTKHSKCGFQSFSLLCNKKKGGLWQKRQLD